MEDNCVSLSATSAVQIRGEENGSSIRIIYSH
jgi:hypothetical protein